jgi:signal transduction histidine kinase
MGANDYITKPIEPEVVEARVETQIQLKKLADERQVLVENLERANNMRNQLMRIASHDLKNPLNNLNMLLQLRAINNHGTEKADWMKMASQSVGQMHSIIMEFLDMDILKEDALTIELEPIVLHDTLLDVIDTYQYTANEKRIRINYRPTPEIVIADRRRLVQVLNNLVSNAIKYSPRDGVVDVAVENSGDTARIHVMDSGVGIAPDEQSQLFKPFSRLSTTPTAGESSTGLGLWIAQQMIAMQNGEIGVNSVDGHGCDFWIELPIALSEAVLISA